MQPEESFYSRLVFLAILLVSVTLPFPVRANSLSAVFLTALWLLGWFSENRFQSRHDFKFLLLVISVYLFFVIGYFYSDDKEYALKELETKIGLLLFPLIFYTLPPISQKKLHIILFAFVAACLSACFFSLISILVEKEVFSGELSLIQPWDLINNNFLRPIGTHPLYLSCYLDFSLIITLSFLVGYTGPGKIRRRFVLALLSCLLIAFNLLILSRMGLAMMAVILTSLLFYPMLSGRRIAIPVLFFTFMVVASFSLYFFNGAFKDRIDILFAKESTNGSFDQRRVLWHSSVGLFAKHWAFGVGTGDVRKELTKEYALNNYTGEYFNCHNEYLQTGNAVGVIGVLLLLLALIVPFIGGVKKSIFHQALLLIVGLGCLTESMLSVQKGVVFYSFFNALFAFGCRQDDEVFRQAIDINLKSARSI